MLRMVKRVYLKCSLLSFSGFKTLGSSHSWSFPSCCVPAFFGDPTCTSTVTSVLDSSSWYTSIAQSGPSSPLLLMQHPHPTLAFKPLIPYLSRNLTLIYLPLSGSLDSLLCDLMASTTGLVFFLLMSQTLAAASSLSSGRVCPYLSFLPSLFLRLTPTLIT